MGMSIPPEPPYTIPPRPLHLNLANLEALLLVVDDMPIDGDLQLFQQEFFAGAGVDQQEHEDVTDEDIVAALEQLSDEQVRDMMMAM